MLLPSNWDNCKAADGQMAVQQSEVNEQLEALHADNVAAHKAVEEITADYDST